MIHLGITVTEHDSIERRIDGPTLGGILLGTAHIHSSDPDQLDRLARELSSAAESLRLARIASAGHAA